MMSDNESIYYEFLGFCGFFQDYKYGFEKAIAVSKHINKETNDRFLYDALDTLSSSKQDKKDMVKKFNKIIFYLANNYNLHLYWERCVLFNSIKYENIELLSFTLKKMSQKGLYDAIHHQYINACKYSNNNIIAEFLPYVGKNHNEAVQEVFLRGNINKLNLIADEEYIERNGNINPVTYDVWKVDEERKKGGFIKKGFKWLFYDPDFYVRDNSRRY